MDREAFVGNVTTIGKFVLLATGTPALVSFANSNEYIIIIGAIFGVIWAFYDSKYFNTFFNRSDKKVEPIMEEIQKEVASNDGLNDEYTTDSDE